MSPSSDVPIGVRSSLSAFSRTHLVLFVMYNIRECLMTRFPKIIYDLQEMKKILPTEYKFQLSGYWRGVCSPLLERDIKQLVLNHFLSKEVRVGRYNQSYEIVKLTDKGVDFVKDNILEFMKDTPGQYWQFAEIVRTMKTRTLDRHGFDEYEKEVRKHLLHRRDRSNVALDAFLHKNPSAHPIQQLNEANQAYQVEKNELQLILPDKPSNSDEPVELYKLSFLVTLFPKLGQLDQAEIIAHLSHKIDARTQQIYRNAYTQFFPTFWAIVCYLHKEKVTNMNQLFKYLKNVVGLKISPKSLHGWISREILKPLEKAKCIEVRRQTRKILIVVNEPIWSNILGQFMDAESE